MQTATPILGEDPTEESDHRCLRPVLRLANCAGGARHCADKDIRHCREFMPSDADELHGIARLFFEEPRSEVLGWQVLLEAQTGLRTIEILRLRTDAQPNQPGPVTPEGRSLCVWRAKGQEGVSPCVEIRDGLELTLAALFRWKQERFPDAAHYLPSFRLPGMPVHVGSLGHALRRIRRQLKRKITSHGLRAYYVTVRRSQGIADWQIAWEIGHTSGGRTLAEVYGGVPPHWFDGQGPKMSWLPKGQPAWMVFWPEQETETSFDI